jgi:hypothetical protein
MRRRAARVVCPLAAAGMAALLAAAWPLHPPLRAAGQTATSSAAPLPRAWDHWRYIRTIPLSPAGESRLVGVLIPQEVYERASPGLADLRILDDRGDEVPYAALTVRGSIRTETRAIRHSERSTVAEKYLQLVLDLGPNPAPHNGLRVQTPATDYIGWAEVAVSDNGRDWRSVRDRAPLFRFEKRQIHGKSLVPYPETRARYLRVRIAQQGAGFPVEGVTVLDEAKSPADRAAVAARMEPAKPSMPRASAWQTDLGGAIPLDELDFETSQPEFSRHVEVFASNGRDGWTRCGEGDIYRIRREDSQQESLRLDFGETTARYWRVEVANGTEPLAGVRLRLYMTPRRIVFRQQPGRRYRLLYGQSEAAPPEYDLAQTVAASELPTAPLAAGLGAEEINSAWVDPRPWTERQPAVLWLAMALAAAILGYAALRAHRRPA